MTASVAKTRFTYMVARQSMSSVSVPPSSSPIEAPLAPIAPKMPNARPRSRGSVNVVVSSDRHAGASSAANSPCSARDAVSMANELAAPPSADASAKPDRPVTSVRLRPNRSESLPPSRSRLPKASRYAVRIHSRSWSEKPSASWAEGSATFMIVVSSTTMSCATREDREDRPAALGVCVVRAHGAPIRGVAD